MKPKLAAVVIFALAVMMLAVVYGIGVLNGIAVAVDEEHEEEPPAK